jgi:hypothetical protein
MISVNRCNNGTSGEKFFSADSSAKVFSQGRRGLLLRIKILTIILRLLQWRHLAYDSSNNNLVYMPMFSSNIYVLNPQTKEITLVENNVARVTSCDINSHITRMTTGYNGNIYAVNNAGTHF